MPQPLSHRKISLTWPLILLLIVTIAGCGFHLRGQYQLPQELARIDVNTERLAPSWQTQVKRKLIKNNIAISKAAPIQLYISDISEGRKVASYNDRAKAAEYELYISMSYQLLNTKSNVALPKKKLTSKRAYRFDENTVTAKQEEERIIKQELAEELFAQLFRQLQWVDYSALTTPVANSSVEKLNNTAAGDAQ